MTKVFKPPYTQIIGRTAKGDNVTIDVPWYRFMSDMVDRVGGFDTPDLDDVNSSLSALSADFAAANMGYAYVDDPDYAGLVADGDWTNAIQAAIDKVAAFEAGGVVWFYGAKTISGVITKPNNVSLLAPGIHTSSLVVKPGLLTVAGLIDYPTVGKPKSEDSSTRCEIGGFFIEGSNAGFIELTGDVTSGSDVITSPSVTEGLEVGYRIEGVGIPSDTTILDVSPLTISAPATLTNTYQRKLIVRPAWTVTATSTLDSRDLIVTSGDYSQFRPYMKLGGANLETDGDDLNKHTRIQSIEGAVITMDRPASATGSFQVTAYIYNTGLLIAEPKTNPDYKENKEYRAPYVHDLKVLRMSGDAVRVAAKRDQFYGFRLQGKLCWGYGFTMTASNDSRMVECGFGSNWYSSHYIAFCMPRITACDAWEPLKRDTAYTVQLRKCREAIYTGCDISSTIYVLGYDDDKYCVSHFSGCNLKVKEAGKEADGLIAAIVTADDAQVVVVGGVMKADREDGTAAQYLAKTMGVGSVIFSGQIMEQTPIVAVDQTATPYIVGIETGGNVGATFFDPTTGQIWTYGAHAFDSAQANTLNAEPYEVMVGGDTDTIGNKVSRKHYTSGFPIATYTVKFPPGPDDRQEVEIVIHAAVTSLTIAPNTGQTINATDAWPTSVSTLPTSIRASYRADTSTWYLLQADATGGGGGGGSGAAGVAVVNFTGAGGSDTSVAVTGQAGILAGSSVFAQVTVADTATHTADEHWIEELDISAGNIIPGTGFTIYAKTRNVALRGRFNVSWKWE